jgi:hypothetical protein
MSKKIPYSEQDFQFDYVDPFSSKTLLGTYTKLGNPPSHVSALRVERWGLKTASRLLLFPYHRRDKKDRLQKKFRVTQCLRLPLGYNVPIQSKNDVAHYTKLNVCGSVWTCPICATKITEGRRNELSSAVAYWQNQGGSVALVTTTIPHKRTQRLMDILVKVQCARRKWRNRKPFKQSVEDFGICGTVRALEVNYGMNGWHVHFHELYFYNLEGKKYVNTPNHLHLLQADLSQSWRYACVSAGIKIPSSSYGLDVRNGDFAADYIAKFGRESNSGWGVDQELVKGHIKKSRGGFSPFDMLRSYLATGDISPTAPSQYFIEFALSMLGKKQLFWSPGLKGLLHVVECSDQELAEHVDTESILLGTLTLDQWRFILKHSFQGQVLEYANLGGIEAVNDYLISKGY